MLRVENRPAMIDVCEIHKDWLVIGGRVCQLLSLLMKYQTDLPKWEIILCRISMEGVLVSSYIRMEGFNDFFFGFFVAQNWSLHVFINIAIYIKLFFDFPTILLSNCLVLLILWLHSLIANAFCLNICSYREAWLSVSLSIFIIGCIVLNFMLHTLIFLVVYLSWIQIGIDWYSFLTFKF